MRLFGLVLMFLLVGSDAVAKDKRVRLYCVTEKSVGFNTTGQVQQQPWVDDFFFTFTDRTYRSAIGAFGPFKCEVTNWRGDQFVQCSHGKLWGLTFSFSFKNRNFIKTYASYSSYPVQGDGSYIDIGSCIFTK